MAEVQTLQTPWEQPQHLSKLRPHSRMKSQTPQFFKVAMTMMMIFIVSITTIIIIILVLVLVLVLVLLVVVVIIIIILHHFQAHAAMHVLISINPHMCQPSPGLHFQVPQAI